MPAGTLRCPLEKLWIGADRNRASVYELALSACGPARTGESDPVRGSFVIET
jgi:hypothetical protein